VIVQQRDFKLGRSAKIFAAAGLFFFVACFLYRQIVGDNLTAHNLDGIAELAALLFVISVLWDRWKWRMPSGAPSAVRGAMARARRTAWQGATITVGSFAFLIIAGLLDRNNGYAMFVCMIGLIIGIPMIFIPVVVAMGIAFGLIDPE
jgi:hypothetical protein